MSVIEIKNLSKSFAGTRALQNVTTRFEAEVIYGLLGRNGAGKTTLINILTNKIFADSGEILIDGEAAAENDRAQAKMFCMTEKNVHPAEMKVKDALRWAYEFNPLFDREYAAALVEKFKLDTGKRIKNLSSGYNSVFKSILTMASGRPVMIFDEPVLGLDAAHRELFYRELIARYSEKPATVIIATHLIDEVADVLEQVLILKNGALALDRPVAEVLQLAYTVSGEAAGVDRYTSGKNVVRQEAIGKFKAATIYQERQNGDKEHLRELGLEVTPARLQEIFISLTEN